MIRIVIWLDGALDLQHKIIETHEEFDKFMQEKVRLCYKILTIATTDSKPIIDDTFAA